MAVTVTISVTVLNANTVSADMIQTKMSLRAFQHNRNKKGSNRKACPVSHFIVRKLRHREVK